MRGSATIEASLVVPICIGVIVFIILAGFYMHDRTIIQGTLGEVSSIAEIKNRIGEKINDADIKEYFNDRIKGKVLYTKSINVKSIISEKEIIINGEFDVLFGKIPLLSQILKSKTVKTNIKSQRGITSPEDNIRNTNAIKEGVADISVEEEK